MFGRYLYQAVFLIISAMAVSGCYYMQAARGQLELLNKREPIAELITQNDTPAELSRRLALVLEARQFSIQELYLPDNYSYRSYAHIDRDYVVWNVFAAPEFSLQPKSWCFPVAGCVNYRGYFAEDSARHKAAQLNDEGFDVAVGGIAAYSTLGKFSDPVLNTMMHWEDTDLIAVMFHELAHQLLYVKGDSAFNESFATAVEEFGIERWLAGRGQSKEIVGYQERRELRKRLMQHVETARQDLELIYASTLPPEDMRAGKLQRFKQLNGELTNEFDQQGGETPAWVNEDLNNARLASMSLYQGRLAEFRDLFAQCDQDIRCFYRQAKTLSEET